MTPQSTQVMERMAEEWWIKDRGEIGHPKDVFKAGWQACKKHDSDVLALVEALERIELSADYSFPKLGMISSIAEDALAKWEAK